MKHRRKRRKRQRNGYEYEQKGVSNVQLIAWHPPGKHNEPPTEVRGYIYTEDGGVPLVLTFVDAGRLDALIERLTYHHRKVFPDAPIREIPLPPTGTRVDRVVRDEDDHEGAPVHYRRVQSVTVKSKSTTAVFMIFNLEPDNEKAAMRWGSPELLEFFIAELKGYRDFVFGGSNDV